MSVYPSQGAYSGGTQVVIVGHNLVDATAVFFGARAALAFTVLDDRTIVAVTPAGNGTVQVAVTTSGGTAPVGTFSYLRWPALSGLVPTTGPLAGGGTVALTGTGLSTASSVHFGNAAEFPTVLNDQQLLVTAPPAAVPGTVAVYAIAIGGVSNQLAYRYAATPQVSSVTPADGPVAGATTIVIGGTGLSAATGVTVGGIAAPSFRSYSDALILAVTPPGVAGPTTVTVTTPGGTSALPDAFSYLAASVTALTSEPDPSVSGQPVVFTATVTAAPPGAGAPTGTVTFGFGDGTPPVTAPLVEGTVTVTHAYADPSGSPYTVTAAYSGDDLRYPSSDTVTHTVQPAATTVTVAPTPDPSAAGEPVTFVARVAPVAQGVGTVTGTVTFDFGDGTAPVTVAVSGAAASTTHAYAHTAGTPYTVTIDYSGDTGFAPATGTATQSVVPAESTTLVSPTPTPSTTGEPVTVTAAVAAAPPGGGTPTGTVTFDFNDGTTPVTAPLTAGVATTAHAFAGTAGSPFTVSAAYGGDADIAPSMGTGSQTVQPAATITALGTAPDPAVVGQQVTFTATVTTTPPGAGAPTGTVTFDFGDSTPPVTATLSAGGVATTTHTYGSTADSPFTVTATYDGSPDCTASQDTGSQTVQPAATITALGAAPDPAVVGQQVTFTATVTTTPPGAGAPIGTVTFDFGDSTPPVTATLSAGGVATTTHAFTQAAATYPVTATYNGSPDYITSQDSGGQPVQPAATTTTVDAAPHPAVVGQTTTFVARVIPQAPASGSPSGTVTFGFSDGTGPLTAPVVGGTAIVTRTSPGVSDSPITVTAAYSSDSDFTASTGSGTVAVAQAMTTTEVSTAPDPSVTDEAVTFTATVAALPPASGTPTGTVTFDFGDGTTPVSAALAGGTATTVHTYTGAAVVPYSVSVTYGGDTDFTASTCAATHTVEPAGTTTAVTASPAPSVTGEPVTVTVVPAGAGSTVPTGTVSVDFGDGTPAATVLLVAGTATVVHAYTGTAGSPYTLTADYSGDTDFAPSQGIAVQTVTAAATTTSVAATAEPSATGQTVTLIARVAADPPGSGAPGGTVTFDFGDGTTPAAAALTGGAASVTHAYTGTEGSPYTLTAAYDGDTDFAPSTGTGTHAVAASVSATATTVTAAPEPSTSGQEVAFTASVAAVPPASGTPTGSVTFDFGDGSTPVAATLSSGTADSTHTYATAAGSPYTVTTVYGGDADFAGSTGIESHGVSPAVSTTALVTAPAAAATGQSVTFTATVTGGGATPTGTVTFDFGDGTPAVTVPVTGGVATTVHAYAHSAGSPYAVTAAYSGDAGVTGSTATGTQTVTAAASSTAIVASPGPSVVGQEFVFIATVGVLPPASVTPTGTVTFDFGDGTPAVTVPVTGGVAVGTHAYTDTTGSPYTISAAYSGDGDIAASSGAIGQAVGPAGTTTSAAGSPASSVVGEPVTITATVTPVAPGSSTPTGTVTFDFGDGTAPLTAPLVGGAATVAPPYAAASGSPYVVTAEYGGSTQYTGSLGTATQTVGQAGTTTTVSPTPDPSLAGQPVTVSATVAPAGPGAGTPTGTVTFDFGDGSPPVPAPLGGGTATAEHTYDGQAVGDWTIGAAYSGDGDFAASAGTATQTVRRAMTALAVTSSAGPSVAGQPVTFTATAAALAPGDGTPTGTVTFDFGDGTGPVTAPLIGRTAAATHTYTDAEVSGTPYSVTASYGGDTGFRPSNGALTQTVARAGTVTAVTTSPDPSVAGGPVTVTATVTPAAPGAGSPTGTVAFAFGDGTPAVAVPMADGTAVSTHAYLETGGSPYTVTAAYGGDTDFAPSAGTDTHTTGQAATTTALSELPDPSVTGQPVTFTAVVSAAVPGTGLPTGSVTFDFGDGSAPVAVPSAGGTATVQHTYSAQTGSPCTVTAAYDGDEDFAASVATATHTLLRARTEVTITPSNEPSLAGEAVAFTAAVAVIAPGDGTPTGTVTFDFGDGTPAVTVPVSGGTALGTHTYTHAAGTPYAVTATYNGDTGFRPSTGVLAQIVGRAGTATSVTTSPDPSVAGQSVTLTATVAAIAPGVGTPTGTVTFDFGDGIPAVTAALSGGTATATHPYAGTTGSPYPITAVYGGDTDFAPSSGTDTHTTGRAATSTTVTTSPDPSAPEQQVTVIARVGPVAPGAGTPAGSVTFDFGDATPPVSAPLSGGVATATHTFADVSGSPYDVTAAYTGDTDFTASSGTGTQTITADAVATATTVSSAPNPSVTGQTVNVTATVSATAAGAGVPTGGVTFDFGDGTPPVTATVNGAVATAQHTYTGPADRTFSVTAAYNGDATFSSSTGTTVQTVDKAPATATVTTSPGPSVAGQPVTITATVTPAGAGAGVPTGTVTFDFGDGTPSASAPLTNGMARLTHTYAHTAGSPYPVAASYNGDGDFTPVGAATSQTVTAALATVALASSPDPSVVGQPVTFTATVAPVAPGAGTPTGTLTFTFGDGTAPVTAALTGGIATAQHAYGATGSYAVSAAYSGDADFAAAAGTDAQTVSRAMTTTALVSSPDPSVVGQPVTFTATVAPVAPGAGTPTGTVTFTFGDGTATAPAPLVNGVATTQHTYSAAGPYTVTAAYGNDSNFRSSSGTDAQTIKQAATTTALTSSPDPSVVGQPVTFTATVAPVAPGAGTPTGTVTFTFGDGTATAPAPLVNGVATLTHTYGTRSGSPFTVTAAYNGSPDHAPSTGTDTQTVNQGATTTTVATTPDPSVVGQPVTFTATVAPVAPGAGTPTGTVTFTFGDGTATAPAPLVNGVATLTHTYGTRSGSPFTVTAAYNGSPDHAPSTGTDIQILNRATTTTALTSSPNPCVVGQPVTLIATVAPAAPATGTPTGTVTFTWGDGTASASAPLVNGVATLTHTYATRSGSPLTVTAAYGGDTSYTTSSGTGTQTVNQATTTTTVTSTPDPSGIGQQVAVTAAVAAATPASGTPTGTVKFSFGNGTAPVTAALANGVATATTTYSGTTGSPFSITAAYGGDTGYAPSTGTDTQTVSGAATTTAVTTSPNPSRPGNKITTTATVAVVPPATGTPTGYVTLALADRETQVLPLKDGIATTTFTSVNPGTYPVTATYSGTGTFAPSTGTTTQIVNQPS